MCLVSWPRGTDFLLRVHPFYSRPHGKNDLPRGPRKYRDASEERDNVGASGFSRILFKCFSGTQCVRSNRFKTTEHPHLHAHLHEPYLFEYKSHFFVPENQSKNWGATYTRGYVK